MLPANRITSHPGEILLEEFLDPAEVTQADFARAIRIPLNRVNEIVKGKRGVTAETAILFAEYFGNSPQFWMGLQANHDLSKALLKKKNSRSAPRLRRKSGVA